MENNNGVGKDWILGDLGDLRRNQLGFSQGRVLHPE